MVCVSGGRVFKNKKMPGHTGSAALSEPSISKILPENLLLIKGSVPGSKGTILTVQLLRKPKFQLES